jgi:hypothetical protein
MCAAIPKTPKRQCRQNDNAAENGGIENSSSREKRP